MSDHPKHPSLPEQGRDALAPSESSHRRIQRKESLAMKLLERGMLEDAENEETMVVEMRQEVSGANDLSTLISLSNLAMIYQRQGKYEFAASLQQDGLKRMEQATGVNKDIAATLRANLASTYDYQHRLGEAQKQWAECLEMRRQIHGDKHPQVLTPMFELARIHLEEGRVEEASVIALQAAAIAAEAEMTMEDPRRIKAQALLEMVSEADSFSFTPRTRALSPTGSMEATPPFVTEKPLEHTIRQRASLLSALHEEPASLPLQDYFERLKEGSPSWDIDAFIDGAKAFAAINGTERANCYDNSLKGLHYPNSLTALWNGAYATHQITVWDLDFRRQCPPSWFHDIRGQYKNWVLVYRGQAPLSQGINQLIKGPTTLDCGMFSQLLLCMAIRYVAGDALFDKLLEVQGGEFILTQNWAQQMNEDCSEGTLLHRFYDHPIHKLMTSNPRTGIQTRTLHNDKTYLAKHPGGFGRLQNVTQIGDHCICFDPGASKDLLSFGELDDKLMESYNAPRDFADCEKLWWYSKIPTFVHPDDFPKSYHDLLVEAEKYVFHTFTKDEWNDRRWLRELASDGLHLTFNFSRLLDCLEELRLAAVEKKTLSADICEH